MAAPCDHGQLFETKKEHELFNELYTDTGTIKRQVLSTKVSIQICPYPVLPGIQIQEWFKLLKIPPNPLHVTYCLCSSSCLFKNKAETLNRDKGER